MKKIFILFILTLGLLPFVQQNAKAQTFATESVVNEDGSIEHWHHVDWVYDQYGEWIYDYTEYPQGNGDQPDPDPYDPSNPSTLDDDYGWDWADIMDYLDWLDQQQGANPIPPIPPLPSSTGIYKIQSSSDNFQINYVSGSQITLLASGANSMATLIFQFTDPNLTQAQLKWARGGAASCTGTVVCHVPTDHAGSYNVQVFKSTTNTELIHVTVVVSGKTFVKFHQKTGYDSKYGFDEQGYIYPVIASNYSSITVDNKPYHVPWMSVVDGQSAEIKLEPEVLDADANNPNFKVKFVPTNSHILVNGQAQLVNISGATLKTMTSINVYSEEWNTDPTAHAQEAIEVINNSNEVIGKIMVSCQKPVERKFVIVYVKVDASGFPANNNTTFMDYINNRGHNQLHRKFNLQPTTSFTDQLDLTPDLAVNSGLLNNNLSNWNHIFSHYYNVHTGIDPEALNPSTLPANSRTYFMFVTTKNNPNEGGSTNVDNSITYAIDYSSNPNYKYGTAIHELGHALHFAHSWLAGVGAEYSTDNFMDYSTYTDKFYLYQWLSAY